MKLKISNLEKAFAGKTVLKDINIDLEHFRSLAIIGPSGGGKSTLLRMLAGLQRPDRGEIHINGERIDYSETLLHEYRKTIGVVFQSYNLFPHLTALDNITLPLTVVHKFSKEKAEIIALDLLDRFQLKVHMDKKPHQLSGGQQQRIAVARALSIESRFLLFDEPTSALDPELTSEVLDMIKELQEQDKDLILVTHEMGFARQSCDYVLFIADGQIIEHGPSAKIFKEPQTLELKNFLNKILEWR
ncbi:L-cystine import ATP-binding protein TcyC [bioreactor metagenome]|uniref:Glutamate transport ATP-binding protein GluA n=2 Tax=root TaxID=1 RepID=A0A098B2Z5_DESHA|nr:amino acid ABC transporter ATP-binding protein [Desulfitobacterium hafniense]MEA5024621.1 amino acid ABC transporter ATP-binding protein [Desulfitobacterium hafniense]CDX02730.1 Glutamate transport ATP-binding protein GluA [Desulfitobacterium hafniense]